jgi:hypothetical protein
MFGGLKVIFGLRVVFGSPSADDDAGTTVPTNAA